MLSPVDIPIAVSDPFRRKCFRVKELEITDIFSSGKRVSPICIRWFLLDHGPIPVSMWKKKKSNTFPNIRGSSATPMRRCSTSRIPCSLFPTPSPHISPPPSVQPMTTTLPSSHTPGAFRLGFGSAITGPLSHLRVLGQAQIVH